MAKKSKPGRFRIIKEGVAFIDKETAGEKLGVTDWRIKQLCQDGEIPGAEKLAPRLWIIPEAAIEKLAKALKEKPARKKPGKPKKASRPKKPSKPAKRKVKAKAKARKRTPEQAAAGRTKPAAAPEASES